MVLTNADYRDIQGLLRYGYGRLAEACFLLLRIDDPAAASRWLETAPVTTAEEQNPPPVRALQLAFTCEGLRKLGISEDQLNNFSAEFISGMSGDENRSRRLGGVEPFGFVDGVSEPKLDWERRRNVAVDKISYENVSMLGEFVLGYPNEY